jgi:hypothetical protein
LPAIDFNGDGRLDFLANSSDGGEGFGSFVDLYLGRGDGTFDQGPSFGTYFGWPAPIAARDFNGDGRTDLALGGAVWDGEAWAGGVAVWLNNGAWTDVSIGDVTVTEGNTGTATATFTLTLSAASAQTITVAYQTGGGIAAGGSDYQTATGTLTFAPGETSKTITVSVNGDRLGEPNETFFVYLSGATNANLTDGVGAGTILDDESRISISDVSKREGNGKKATWFTFTVTLSAAYDQPVTMSFQTVNATATTGDNDYIARSGTLTFAPSETTQTITIEVKGDSKREANETFYLDLFGNSGNALLTRNHGLGTILNDDRGSRAKQRRSFPPATPSGPPPMPPPGVGSSSRRRGTTARSPRRATRARRSAGACRPRWRTRAVTSWGRSVRLTACWPSRCSPASCPKSSATPGPAEQAPCGPRRRESPLPFGG